MASLIAQVKHAQKLRDMDAAIREAKRKKSQQWKEKEMKIMRRRGQIQRMVDDSYKSFVGLLCTELIVIRTKSVESFGCF